MNHTEESLSPKASHNKAGRSDFQNQRFEHDRGKKTGWPLSPYKHVGLRRLHRAKKPGNSLIFLSLLFGEKQGKPPEKARIYLSAEPLKSLGRRENAQKIKEIPINKQNKEIQKRQGKEDQGLDGRNRTIVLAELLARVIVAIRIVSVRWWSYLPQEHRN